MELDAYLEVAADHVDRLIDRYFGAPVGDLNRAAAHLLTAGGKRLRPALLMLAADAVRPHSSDDLMPAALALELTHTFTLIHDDIMDRDMFRRGVPTVNNRWDEPTAILAGDVLYSRAFSFLIGAIAPEAARLRAVGMLAITCDELCLGQHLDMSFASRDDVTEGEYLDMVEKKTGSLYAASAAIGAVLAGASEPQIEVLHRFGLACGVAFQIQDDLIDLQPTLRDAVVLDLPLAPLCSEDCLGLCPVCGVRLEDDPSHAHEATDPRWAALATLQDPDA